MADQQKQQWRIIFTERADLILADIVKKYGLEESDEEILKLVSENKPSRAVIIIKITKEFVQEIIPEKELTNSLQKELNVSQETTEKISQDIKEKLVPLLEKIPEQDLEKPPEEISPKKEKIPFESIPIGELAGEPTLAEETSIKKETLVKEKLPINKKPLPKIKKEIKKPSPTKPDAYREPID